MYYTRLKVSPFIPTPKVIIFIDDKCEILVSQYLLHKEDAIMSQIKFTILLLMTQIQHNRIIAFPQVFQS